MTTLLDLSAEVLQLVLQHAEPIDLASLAKTCKSFYQFLNPNPLLWKSVYFQHYDEPSHLNTKATIDWPKRLQLFTKVDKTLSSSDPEIKRENFKEIGSGILDMIASSNSVKDLNSVEDVSQNLEELKFHFERQSNVDAFLCSSSLFIEAGTDTQIPRDDKEEQQLSAKLHVFYGVPMEPTKRRAPPLHTYARSRVYDLRKYNFCTKWGPFRPDGSGKVDWERLESIMVVLAFNLNAFRRRTCQHFDFNWTDHFSGCAAQSFISQAMPQDPPMAPANLLMLMAPVNSDVGPLYNQPRLPDHECSTRDPYGVRGTWRRVVCFLDYTDLYEFNFEFGPDGLGNDVGEDQERHPIATQEAIRLITIKMWPTKIEAPGPEDGQDYPVVHFNGQSRSLHTNWDPNAHSKMRGVVRQTKEGEIRWTSWSLFHGEERWRSECVQIGGIGSARGVLGTWFDKDYDAHGPAGPTAFWKISDDIGQKKTGEEDGEDEDDVEVLIPETGILIGSDTD